MTPELSIWTALLAFAGAAGLLTIVPGLDTLLVLRTATVEGPRRAMFAGLGVCTGCLAWGILVSAGLGAVFAVSNLAYQIVRIAGAIYLFYLGLRLLFQREKPVLLDSTGEAASALGSLRCFIRGLLTNLLNPKVGVFYVTFLPQFIPSHVNVIGFSVLLALVHDVEGILRLSTVRCRIGKRFDDFELLDHRSRPAMSDDHRQRVGMLRANLDEMDIDAVNIRDELR